MTNAEYKSAKRKLTASSARHVLKKLRQIRIMYTKSAARTEKVIARLPGGTLSPSNRAKILKSVNRNALYDKIVGYIDDGRKTLVSDAFSVDKKYLEDAFKSIGKIVNLSPMFDRQAERINKKYKAKNTLGYVPVAANSFVVRNRAEYTLSSAIWESIDGYSDKILAIVQAELEAGTDPVKIARLIEQYLAGGAEVVLGRWGDLKIGTTEYRKRLGTKGADYRTQRVVRTEMYSARRDADIKSGEMNPGATDKFTWHLSPASNHCDECEENASGGPYTADEVQDMNNNIHPQCSCYVEPVMKNEDDFVQSLRDYVHGEDTAGAAEIETWASKYGFDTE